VEANLLPSTGHGNGGRQRLPRTEVEDGAILVVYDCVRRQLCGLLTFEQFVEYDQRAHRLNPLAMFSFWVNSKSCISTALPNSPNPPA
jgi:hypothetical protein